MKLKAIAFDLDGTLYPNWQMYALSILHVARQPRLFITYSKIRKKVRTYDSIENLYRLEAGLLKALTHKSTEENYSLLQKTIYGSWLNVFSKIKIFPEVVEHILDLKEKENVKLGLMSDFPLKNKLADLKLEAIAWDVQFSSMETNFLKPHAQPFLELAKRLDCLPEEICYIGNNYRYDVLGAKAVGMKTGLLSSKGKKHFPEADFVFSHYSRLHDHIRNL